MPSVNDELGGIKADIIGQFEWSHWDPAPSFIAVSTSFGEASPLSTNRTASIKLGTNNLLTIKPGVSLADTHVLPMALPHSIMAVFVSSEVSGIRMTSSKFMTGTGLKKWSPPKRSRRSGVALAMSLIGNED